MKLVAADTTSWEWKSEKERERERFCLRGVIFVLHKIFKTPAFILIAAGLCVVTGMCEWSLYQSAYRLRVSDGFNVCVRARSAQRETERARNFGDCVNEERRGEGGWGVGLNPRWMKQPSVILHHSYETRGGGTCLGGEWTMSGRREKREAVNFQPKWGGTNLLVFSLEILAKQHLMQSLVSSNSLVLPFSTFLLFPVIQAWFFISLLRLHPLVLVPFVLHACTFYLIFSLSFLCLFLLLSSFASSPVSLTVSSSFTSPYLFFAPCSRSSIFVSFSPISFCFSPFLLYSHVQFLFSSLFTLTFPSPLFTLSIPCFSHFLPYFFLSYYSSSLSPFPLLSSLPSVLVYSLFFSSPFLPILPPLCFCSLTLVSLFVSFLFHCFLLSHHFFFFPLFVSTPCFLSLSSCSPHLQSFLFFPFSLQISPLHSIFLPLSTCSFSHP